MSTRSIPTARPAKAVNPDWYESAVVAGWRIGLNNEVKRVQTLQEVVLGVDAMTQRNPARVNPDCRGFRISPPSKPDRRLYDKKTVTQFRVPPPPIPANRRPLDVSRRGSRPHSMSKG